MDKILHVLPKGSILTGESYSYCIEEVLGQGSFGITYLASVKMQGALGILDVKVKVAIKEFFMKDINGREGSTVTSGSKGGLFTDYRKKFVREASNLSKIQHPNIIKVLECFEANNTVYYVMEYLEGGNLDALIEKKHSLTETEAIDYACQIGSALSYMHEHKMLHLDLKPGNIMLHEGHAVLIDFGLSKQYDSSGNPESSTTVGGGTPGYAPLEQSSYREGKGFPVTMDIYALGATLFKMLVGERAPEASEILNEGFPTEMFDKVDCSEQTMECIGKAMSPMKKDRFGSVDEMLSCLCSAETLGKSKVATHHSTEKPITISSDVTVIDAPTVIPEPTVNEEFEVNGVKFTMIRVEGGTFQMGATSEMEDPYDWEKPVHSVTLSTYYIGETEVTQALWQAVMGSNPSWFKEGGILPVENVSWEDCQRFISKLNRLTGMTFSLPTEAQWEYAARGGNKSRHTQYSGSKNIDDVAWYTSNSGSKTHPVGQKLPNELGLYDMTGNVWEWCSDRYGDYRSSSQTNPTGPNSGDDRVYRGGSWGNGPRYCRSSCRDSDRPSFRYRYLGFRLALL